MGSDHMPTQVPAPRGERTGARAAVGRTTLRTTLWCRVVASIRIAVIRVRGYFIEERWLIRLAYSDISGIGHSLQLDPRCVVKPLLGIQDV